MRKVLPLRFVRSFGASSAVWACSLLLWPLACSDFQGYAPVDAGNGGRGMGGRGGRGGTGGSGAIVDSGTPDSSLTPPDASSLDAGGAAGDAGGQSDGGDAGLTRDEACRAVCATQAQLSACQPTATCAEDLCNAVSVQPNGCSDEYDAYYGCLALEPLPSFTCAGSTPQPNVGNNGCAVSECAYFTCLGVPILCTL